MASAEQSPSSDIIFRGTDGNECEAFVVAIRDLAFAEGKQEDCRWMLHYATSRLRGKALRWHAKLDPSIRKDWDLFVQAMFEEYPLVEESDAGGVATPVWTSTTFSPAPSIATLPGNDVLHTTVPQAMTEEVSSQALEGVRSLGSLPLAGVPVPPQQVYDPSLPGFQFGRLRVVYEAGRPGPHYVSREHRATNTIQEALIVAFIPSSESHLIWCLNVKELNERNLGVTLYASSVSEFHPLVGTSDQTVPHSTYNRHLRSTQHSQTVSVVWSILNDGSLLVTLNDLTCEDTGDYYTHYSISEPYSTTTAYVAIAGASILFTKDHTTPKTFHPNSRSPIIRARIVFEPI